jgi:hypothetical protein
MSKPHPTLQDSKVKKLHRHQKFASKTPCNFGNFFAVEITRSPVQNRLLGATGFFLVISDLKTCSTKHMHATHTYVCMASPVVTVAQNSPLLYWRGVNRRRIHQHIIVAAVCCVVKDDKEHSHLM